MPITVGDGLSFCGHALSDVELGMIRGITREFANLTLTELAATLCELLDGAAPMEDSRLASVICSCGNSTAADGCPGCRRHNPDILVPGSLRLQPPCRTC